jgi:GPH family glycoside/pentoside/hexuronide:cation symporter
MTSLLPWSLFAAMIASAGLPIYIHAPKFYVDEYGVSLTALGLVLFGLRLLDVVQDPALGWLAEKGRAFRAAMVAFGGMMMAIAMVALFAIPPLLPPLWWFALCLTALFSGFSLLTICFYAQGVAKAKALPNGHLRLASWRESGSLVGIALAAAAPTVLALVSDRPFAAFAFGFAALVLLAVWAMRREWGQVQLTPAPSAFAILGDRKTQGLLTLALVNAAPVAVTSTLFLFFVESRLEAPGLEGPLLLLFFLSAALTAPFWAYLAQRIGQRRALMAGMALAVISFGFALGLRAGDTVAFALICAASGAALAADMVLLPAVFARHLAEKGGEAMGFGLWSFASKLMLAVAAVTVFPLLQMRGYVSGPINSQDALQMLTLLYAGLPCALKLLAMALLARTDIPEAAR